MLPGMGFTRPKGFGWTLDLSLVFMCGRNNRLLNNNTFKKKERNKSRERERRARVWTANSRDKVNTTVVVVRYQRPWSMAEAKLEEEQASFE
jgi:hypothetical protein